MAYLIDGHNLIGKMVGLNLKEMDDEMILVNQLQIFCRIKRRKIEVYFDGAPPGFARTRQFGQVTAHFIQDRVQADDAIIQRLNKMGRKARNWIVVSSDRRIQAQARSQHASVVTSEDFAAQLTEAQRLAYDLPADDTQRGLHSEEVDYWLKVFQKRDGEEPSKNS